MRDPRTALLAVPLLLLVGACGPDRTPGEREVEGAAPQTAPNIVPATVPPAPGTMDPGAAPAPLPMDTVGRMSTQPGVPTDSPARPRQP